MKLLVADGVAYELGQRRVARTARLMPDRLSPADQMAFLRYEIVAMQWEMANLARVPTAETSWHVEDLFDEVEPVS